MLTQEHAQTALDFLEKADKRYADGDQAQASAKMWEAATHAVMSAATERGWSHASQTELRHAAGLLSEEYNAPLIASGFAIAEKYLHDSRYLFMEDYEWTLDRRKVHGFVGAGADPARRRAERGRRRIDSYADARTRSNGTGLSGEGRPVFCRRGFVAGVGKIVGRCGSRGVVGSHGTRLARRPPTAH